jgi:hypothetical protein
VPSGINGLGTGSTALARRQQAGSAALANVTTSSSSVIGLPVAGTLTGGPIVLPEPVAAVDSSAQRSRSGKLGSSLARAAAASAKEAGSSDGASMDYDREPGAAKRNLAKREEEERTRSFVPQKQNFGWVPPGMEQPLPGTESLAQQYDAWNLQPEEIDFQQADATSAPLPDDDDMSL